MRATRSPHLRPKGRNWLFSLTAHRICLAAAVEAAGLERSVQCGAVDRRHRRCTNRARRFTRLGDRRILGCSPRMAFVSSNRWDVMGAVSFGFQAYWVNRAGAPDEYQDFPPQRRDQQLRSAVAGLTPARAVLRLGKRSLSKSSLEHDPEKWVPVFRKDDAQTRLERDADQTITHPALGSRGTPLNSTVAFSAATICCLVSRVPSSPSINNDTRPLSLMCRAQLMASSSALNSFYRIDDPSPAEKSIASRAAQITHQRSSAGLLPLPLLHNLNICAEFATFAVREKPRRLDAAVIFAVQNSDCRRATHSGAERR